MAKDTIDNREYELDSLSPETRLHLTEVEINRLNLKLAGAPTGRA